MNTFWKCCDNLSTAPPLIIGQCDSYPYDLQKVLVAIAPCMVALTATAQV